MYENRCYIRMPCELFPYTDVFIDVSIDQFIILRGIWSTIFVPLLIFVFETAILGPCGLFFVVVLVVFDKSMENSKIPV
ncbi:hypothetical protein L6452_18173 [Arctium lappa]|uniref:Uncharacterized protein n=1 Tax=Arctium lappa TaxID=4217 RepID=A0ACB9C5S4_ARCLA|nr:hypothetical protein L6452_18173 [Arctium lappa]